MAGSLSPVLLQIRRGCAAAALCLVTAPQLAWADDQTSKTSQDFSDFPDFPELSKLHAAAAGDHVQPIPGRLVGTCEPERAA